ncbi:hypothetical protein CWI39_0821p0010 [Hamiltosporidium magnivora]|uniref:Uncharacterized protein n=1 Tax=Hamiltosporidium magnivora TaxID=148818 RepID=A0A4V2JUF3_9MICR|nr:hypothetical protein CWI39_1808p0010 [Hamiltosporidium magnivora]TBU04329.1 hypothetical protein CWI39_0821p0010 [Hamiltosporidium magnivora]
MALIHSIKKATKTISDNRRRGLKLRLNSEENWEKTSLRICLKIQNKKKLPNILDNATTIEEENINMNEDLDLEKDNEVVKIVKILFKRKKNRETHNFIIMIQLISIY